MEQIRLYLGIFIVALVYSASPALAEVKSFRWTGSEDSQSDFAHVLSQVNLLSGVSLTESDFLSIEKRDLATSQFEMRAQASGGLPIRGASIRIWRDLNTQKAVQVEAFVETKPVRVLERVGRNIRNATDLIESLTTARSRRAAEMLLHQAVATHDLDNQIKSMKTARYWDQGRLIQISEIKGRRGLHKIEIDLESVTILSHRYIPFSKKDSNLAAEFTVPAQIYPIYEETYVGSKMQVRVPAELRYLRSSFPHSDQDPYGEIKKKRYTSNLYDPLLGILPEGQAKGFWATAYIRSWAHDILNALPIKSNTFGSGGVVLEGRFATVSLHPAVIEKFKDLEFVPTASSHLKMDWREVELNGEPVWEMVPLTSLRGRPLLSLYDAWNRPAIKDPANNPSSYLNHGFDEVQVYYAITRLFESLQSKGFTDPDLSTRPFHAFLYDPDISMADNAYYTDDTINFTTYSPGAPNMARDNPTIWHELGHGIMDRMMGDLISLADTGGLSEGMADFVAELVTFDVSQGLPFDGWEDFRIINSTGFNLTNEVHDDGEAYGGAMRDILVAALQADGKRGLHQIVDLTLEAMRLTRNHPGLTAQDWFSHMIFADELGRAGLRQPGELKALILAALKGRNFSLSGQALAQFSLKYGTQEVTSESLGSRGNPVRVTLKSDEKASFDLQLSTQSGEVLKLQYPVTAKIFFREGPLQGAVKWEAEDQGAQTLTLQSESDLKSLQVVAHGTCDSVNLSDGGCVDYIYVNLYQNGAKPNRPFAKKRFYVRVKPALL